MPSVLQDLDPDTAGVHQRRFPPTGAALMLLALTVMFALSQSFRTLPALIGVDLQREFELGASGLAMASAVFQLAFAVFQAPAGFAMDRFGVRRTVLAFLPAAVAGALFCGGARSYGDLLAGQALLGVGCAPAFLACTVLIAQRFEAHRFAKLSGLSLAMGQAGLIATGTPLAMLVLYSSWRAVFLLLAVLTCFIIVAIACLRDDNRPGRSTAEKEDSQSAGYLGVLSHPRTGAILILAFASYGTFIAVRGLWLGPVLMERFGFSVVESGHITLGVSVISAFGALLAGRLDPGDARRPRRIAACALSMAGAVACMAWAPKALVFVPALIALCLLSTFIVLQYAEVRASYPPALVARALALFNMVLFSGAAALQWASGAVAEMLPRLGSDSHAAALGSIAFMLALATVIYVFLGRQFIEHGRLT